jgi:hypothetical protein
MDKIRRVSVNFSSPPRHRIADAIAERPAVRRGRMVNRVFGEPSEQLPERHDASDFDTRTQDKLNAAGSLGLGEGRQSQLAL